MSEFMGLVRQYQPTQFLYYESVSQQKRIEMTALLSALGITAMTGMRCLDIGPAYGDSLDVWRGLGAAECSFIDKDAWCTQFNRLKGFSGVQGNHLFGMRCFPAQYFDFVWSRGAISYSGRYLRLTKSFGFRFWLNSISRLARGRIVLCPYRGSTPWMDELFAEHGYRQLPFIAGHHSQLYPVTFVREGQSTGSLVNPITRPPACTT